MADAINLFDVGALLNLKVHLWSARKMITRADLVKVKLDPDQLPKEICNFGRKLLVPKSEIQFLTRIEQRGRKLLERFSVPFGVCNAHFVPLKMLPTIEQQMGELKKEFFERVDSFIVRFDDLVAKVKEDHPEFWEKCLKNHYPSNPKALRSKFQFDWLVFKIAGLGSIEQITTEEMVASQKVQETRELGHQMQDEVREFVGEYVTSMRQETVRFCELMTARINGQVYGEETDTKRLTPKSLSCFRNSVDRFMTMNIFGDGEIEKMLTEFRSTFLDSGVAPNDFESANMKNSVTTALEAIRNKAAAEGESGGFIGELKRRITL